MNKTPSILVDTGFEVGVDGTLTELDIPNVVTTLNAPTKIKFIGTAINWIPSASGTLQEFIAPNVTSINAFLFSGYSRLDSVSFVNLTSITTPNGTQGAFKNCTSLSSVYMPSLTTIAEPSSGAGNDQKGTFYGCTSLETLNLPALVSITCNSNNGGTFRNCTGLTSISLPELQTLGNGNMGQIFGGCTGLTTVTLPKVSYVSGASGQGAFYGCTSLQAVQFGSTDNPVTSIGSYAFQNCTQQGLTITVYTADGNAISGSPWGATNATIVWEEA